MECSFQVRGDARVEKRKEKMWEDRGKRVSRSRASQALSGRQIARDGGTRSRFQVGIEKR